MDIPDRQEQSMNKPSSSSASETDWARVTAMSDEDIDLSDIPETTAEQLAQATFRIGRETVEHLSPVAARMMLAAFPAHIRESFERRAQEIDYPIEAVLEMAIAGFLDGECLNFTDCQPRY
jgi:hypothetical protein